MRPIRYVDVCSGYSAFTQAAEGLCFECAGYAEIEPFPGALLAEHYGASKALRLPDPLAPGLPAKERRERERLAKAWAALPADQFPSNPRVRNFGDFTQIEPEDFHEPIDLLIGGTPCQAFSAAGKRLGLDDPRGNLTLEFLALARRLRVRWLAWENVPGFLSHDGGATMGIFLGLLSQLGFRFAWRVLDAQFIRVGGFPWAVPQRRKRLFLVGYLGAWAGPEAILFDPESLRGNPAPRRSAGETIAPTLSARTHGGGGLETDFDCDGGLVPSRAAFGGNNTAGAINVAAGLMTRSGFRQDFETETFIAEVGGPAFAIQERAGCENPLAGPDGAGFKADVAYTIEARSVPQAVAAPSIAASLTRGAESSGKGGAAGRRQEDDTNLVAIPEVGHCLRAEGFDAAPGGDGAETLIAEVADPLCVKEGETWTHEGTNFRLRNVIPFDTTQITHPENRSRPEIDDPAGTLAKAGHAPTIAFEPDAANFSVSENSNGFAWESDVNPALQAHGESPSGNQFSGVRQGWQVRRLTPVEAERLMGLPDHFTAIRFRGKPAADGPRYKALGNSQAVNVMRWIALGFRDAFDAISKLETPAPGDTGAPSEARRLPNAEG